MKKLILVLLATSICGSALASNFVRLPVRGLESTTTSPATSTLPGQQPPAPEPEPVPDYAQLVASVGQLVFPAEVKAGEVSEVRTVELRNLGPAPATIVHVNATYPYQVSPSDTTCRDVLPVGGTCMLGVTYRPTNAGMDQTGIFSMAATNGYVSGSLKGTAFTLNNPEAQMPAPYVNTGATVVGSTYSMTLVVANTGASLLSLGTPKVTGVSAADFSRVTTGASICGATLPAGQQCNVYIAYTPKAAASGRAPVTVTIPNNGRDRYDRASAQSTTVTQSGPSTN